MKDQIKILKNEFLSAVTSPRRTEPFKIEIFGNFRNINERKIASSG